MRLLRPPEQTVERRQRLEVDIETAFGFFADAHNLERITPPWLRFRVLNPRPIPMHEGTLIDYRLRLHGIPLHWHTRISAWEPGVRFVDEQIAGPFALWHHTHTFDREGDGVVIADRVRYRVGFGPLGAIADRALVRRDVERIFDHRQQAIRPLLETEHSMSARSAKSG